MRLLFTPLFVFITFSLIAQPEFKKVQQNTDVKTYPDIPRGVYQMGNGSERLNSNGVFKPRAMSSLHLSNQDVEVKQWSEAGLPEFISIKNKAFLTPLDFINAIKQDMHILDPEMEFSVKSIIEDDLGMRHTKMQQVLNGVEVYNGEIIIHEKNGLPISMNGNYFPTPKIQNFTPGISQEEAEDIAKGLFEYKPIEQDLLSKLDMEQIES
ncbi:MAG: hypothetical protein AAGK97_03395, partial [Bacteroidota bacterium]